MVGRVTSRADDERLLLMLRLRHRGLPTSDVGRRVGIPSERVRTLTNRVRVADLAESGEPTYLVASAYWGGS